MCVVSCAGFHRASQGHRWVPFLGSFPSLGGVYFWNSLLRGPWPVPQILEAQVLRCSGLAEHTSDGSFLFSVCFQANPPCLLSTVQYISSFYASCLSGEESYWWMQFTAAVEFIKTIDDRKWPRPGPPRHQTVARRQCSSYFESWRLFCLICTASRCFHMALPKQINKLTRWFSFLSAFLSCIFYFLSPNRE